MTMPRSAVSLWLHSLLSLFLPRQCPGCGHPLAVGEGPVCPRCVLGLLMEWDHDWRFHPRRYLGDDTIYLERVGALTRYHRGGTAAHIVHSLKYDRHYELGDWMGRLAVRELRLTGIFDGVDALVPVPLAPSRQRWRGFNQAEMIARGMASELGIDVRTDLLRRVLNHESQTHFSHTHRVQNMEGAFALLPGADAAGCHLMLVDDVMTTGATMKAAAQALLLLPETRLSAFAWSWTAWSPAAKQEETDLEEA